MTALGDLMIQHDKLGFLLGFPHNTGGMTSASVMSSPTADLSGSV